MTEQPQGALSVACPECGSSAEWGCMTFDGEYRSKPHRARVQAAATDVDAGPKAVVDGD